MDLYKVLGVAPDASADVIQKAYLVGYFTIASVAHLLIGILNPPLRPRSRSISLTGRQRARKQSIRTSSWRSKKQVSAVEA